MPNSLVKPLVVFDGDCTFCRAWVNYWHVLTGARVDYEPFQSAAGRFPDIPRSHFENAVHFITPAGEVVRAAEAVLRLLALVPGYGLGWWAYRHVPGFRPAAEWLYGRVARYRDFFYKVTDLLWGIPLPHAGFKLVRAVYLRALGMVYFFAFATWAVQARGLIGSGGILPAANFLAAVFQRWGWRSYVLAPSVFWLNSGDAFLQAVPVAGAALALLLVLGVQHWSLRLLLYAGYLSLLWAGQDFMTFQWDNLLLEAGFIAIFLDLAPAAGIWLGRWLLFRLMFLAGVGKLLSSDITWRTLTALNYHFQTQPLPTLLGWFAHHLPALVLRLITFSALATELAVPFLIFLPRKLRRWGGALIALMQLVILLTGNYAFFNGLTLALCLLTLDDAALQRLIPPRLRDWLVPREPAPAPRLGRVAANGALVIVFVLTGLQALPALGAAVPEPAAAVLRAVRPFRIANNYGLFSVMTVWRAEVVIEGSNDGLIWLEYGFRFKPGDVRRMPGWVAPFQPRLDWQMWFAALGPYENQPWFVNLMARLLEGSPDVLGLFGENPFPEAPPRYVRARLYSYEYTSLRELATTGAWWRREDVAEYFPPAQLRP